MAAITPPPGMAECPECNPCNPELDEDGRPFTCYCCCDTGWVTLEALAERTAEPEPSPPPYQRPGLRPADIWDDLPF